MKKKITLVEVGPRDGLQNESWTLDLSFKREFLKRLSLTGLKRIELGAFVSPKRIPQMADSLRLAQYALAQQHLGKWPQKIAFSALVPNLKGMQIAHRIGLKEVAFFTSASQAFTQKNINCTPGESLQRLVEIKQILPKKCKLRSYISMAFYCPYEGAIPPQKVLALAEKLIDMGCDEVSFGDTIGSASPKDVNRLLSLLLKKIPSKCMAMHFHDTQGMALANIATSLTYGIHVFDASLGGLGGCPYAKGATGNVATEDVAYFMERMGYKTDVDLKALIKINHWIGKKFRRSLPSKISQLPNFHPTKLVYPDHL